MESLKRTTSGCVGRRPRLMLGEQALPVLEPRVVPTIIAGPYYQPHDGTTTTFNEVNGTMQATVSLAPGAEPVKVFYESFDNATAGSTAAGGDHNGSKQELRNARERVLRPGQSVTLTLAEGRPGKAEGQVTGTQFDVLIDPVSDGTPAVAGPQTVFTAGIIAYRDSSATSASVDATIDVATPPVSASVDVNAWLA